MRAAGICVALLLISSLCANGEDEKMLVRFDKKPSWASKPEAVSVVNDDPPYLRMAGQCEISQSVSIPGFESLVFDVRIPSGKKGRLYLKLLEEGRSEYITPTLNLTGTGEWETIEFRQKSLFVAPWSDDDNAYLNFPLEQVYFVFTTGEGATLDLREFRANGKDPRLPTADYPLVKAWIERLAAESKPEIPKPPNAGPFDKVAFYDDGPDLILRTTAYELRLAKDTGKLTSLSTSGAESAWKPEDGNWWSLLTFDGGVVRNGSAASFNYKWEAGAKQLRLAYSFPNRFDVIVVISGTDESLRCKTLIRNLGAPPVRCFRMPEKMTFQTDDLKRMVLPRLGGVELLPGYFRNSRRLGMGYPSDAFSDFAWAETSTGKSAVYAVQDEPMFWSSRLSLRSRPDSKIAEYTRETNTFVGAGGSWVSPSIVFLSGRGALDSFRQYWTDNGLDKSPSLESKLGNKVFNQLRTSVLLKYDFDASSPKGGDRSLVFSAMAGTLNDLPTPTLLHPLCYWNPPDENRRADGGVFDTNYPEFLPPREEFGGSQGFSHWLMRAGWLGLPVMPYTNPTCWSKESLSYRNAGEAVGVKSPDGELVMGWGMVTVTPAHPAVQAKNNRIVDGFTKDYRVDVLFEDQVGARSHDYDFSPSAEHPAAYTQGMIQHAKEASKKIPLMTERGFDHLVPYESGFCGIELGLCCTKHMRGWEWDAYYGEGNWRVFPLETWFAGPHAALYHHDLGQFVTSKSDLSWCLAKGYNMTYPYSFPRDWLDISDAFQKVVCARFFGQRLESFEYLNDDVTKTVFPKVTIYANHSKEKDYAQGENALAPEGCLALDDKGVVVGGILTRLHGLDLQRECIVTQQAEFNRVALRCLSSPDGPIAAFRPDWWKDAEKITLLAVTQEAQTPIEFEAEDGRIVFHYASTMGGEPVKDYVAVYQAN